jgi:hypothetical protein
MPLPGQNLHCNVNSAVDLTHLDPAPHSVEVISSLAEHKRPIH